MTNCRLAIGPARDLRLLALVALMVVSLHGWAELNRRLVRLLAAHTCLVSPRH
jgi:hypothetical protein